jgi:hypothetical protein
VFASISYRNERRSRSPAFGSASFQPYEHARVKTDYSAVLRREQVCRKGRQLFERSSLPRARWGPWVNELGVSLAPVSQLKARLAPALSKQRFPATPFRDQSRLFHMAAKVRPGMTANHLFFSAFKGGMAAEKKA